jgi:hypothetical protein
MEPIMLVVQIQQQYVQRLTTTITKINKSGKLLKVVVMLEIYLLVFLLKRHEKRTKTPTTFLSR